MRATPAALALLSVALTTGCPSKDTTVEPVYEIDEDSYLVVMPFQDPNFRDRWSSDVGHQLAHTTTEYLKASAEFGVRPYQDVLDLLAAEDVSKLEPRDVAALCRAQYVLVCDVSVWDPQDSKSIGITQGKSAVRCRLFKVVKGQKDRTPEQEEELRRQNAAREKFDIPLMQYDRGGMYVASDEVTARYPDGYLDQYGGDSLPLAEAVAGLVNATAKKVSKLYYEHEEAFQLAR